MLTPVQVLYDTFSETDVKPKKKKVTWEEGTCALCGRTTETLPAGSVLGQNFGSWAEVSKQVAVTRLCKECAWACKDKTLLRTPVLIKRSEAEKISWGELGRLLASLDALGSDLSISAPVGGRKLVAPYLKWGSVSADYGVFKWTPDYQKAMKTCIQLNKVGIRGSSLLQDQIPLKVLNRLTPEQHRVVNQMWEYLKFVRHDKTIRMLFAKIIMNLDKDTA